MTMLKQSGDADVFKGTLVEPLKAMPTIGDEMAALEDTPTNALDTLCNKTVEAATAQRRARVAKFYGK